MQNVRRYTDWLAVGLMLLLGTFVAVQRPSLSASAQEPKRYQYRVVEVLHETDAMQRMLNEFGGSGWELVAVTAGDLTAPRMIFKK